LRRGKKAQYAPVQEKRERLELVEVGKLCQISWSQFHEVILSQNYINLTSDRCRMGSGIVNGTGFWFFLWFRSGNENCVVDTSINNCARAAGYTLVQIQIITSLRYESTKKRIMVVLFMFLSLATFRGPKFIHFWWTARKTLLCNNLDKNTI